MTTPSKRTLGMRGAAVFAVAFGLLTVKEGGAVLFGSDAARAAAGAYVPFVLWFNFLAGFAYAIAGIGLWCQQRWGAWLAWGIAGATVLTFAAFGVHVLAGGAYEMRTVLAMALRTGIWTGIALLAGRQLIRRKA